MIKKSINDVILVILICFLVLIFYRKYILKEKPIKINGYSMLIVSTQSMEPTIKENELIIIKECSDYSENEIVTYKYIDGTLITHRIIDIDKNIFTAKGDNNIIFDESANLDQIEGKVIFQSQVIGIFIRYILKYVIFIYLIVLLFLYNRPKKEEYCDKKEE